MKKRLIMTKNKVNPHFPKSLVYRQEVWGRTTAEKGKSFLLDLHNPPKSINPSAWWTNKPKSYYRGLTSHRYKTQEVLIRWLICQLLQGC